MKLFLAGAEGYDYYLCGKNAGCKNFLFSNYHRGNINVEELKNNGDEIIMDSGLFTMMFGAGKGKKYTENDLIDYTYSYINDMKKIGWYGSIVEMDVHKILGLEKLQKFRNIFLKEWDIQKTIFVFHIEEGEEGLKKMCRLYPYIALSIPELRILYGNKVGKALDYFMNIIKKEGFNNKVHLLGCTQPDLLKRGDYYSCDSTSWKSPARYGSLIIFKDGKLKTFNKLNIDIHSVLKKLNIKISRIDYLNNATFCAYQYMLLENYINNKYFIT